MYNESDLAPFQRRLQELRSIVQQDADSGKHPEAMTKLLQRQLNECGIDLLRITTQAAVLTVRLIYRCDRVVTSRIPVRDLSRAHPPSRTPGHDSTATRGPSRKRREPQSGTQTSRRGVAEDRFVEYHFSLIAAL